MIKLKVMLMIIAPDEKIGSNDKLKVMLITISNKIILIIRITMTIVVVRVLSIVKTFDRIMCSSNYNNNRKINTDETVNI